MSKSMASAANAQSVVDRRCQGSDRTYFHGGLRRPANRRCAAPILEDVRREVPAQLGTSTAHRPTALVGQDLDETGNLFKPRNTPHQNWDALAELRDPFRHLGRGSTARPESAPVAYLVTDPGTTSLLARQLLTEEGLDGAEDRFGLATFTVRPLGDILDDWLTAPIAERAPIDALARLMVLEVLLSVGRPRQESAQRVVSETGGATMADLCRQAFAHIERLGRLREAGAPEIVRCSERRLLRATARDLLMAAATKFPPRMASSA